MERLKRPLRMTTAFAVVVLLQLSGWSLSRQQLIVSAQRTKTQTQRSQETRHSHLHRQLNPANVETFITEIAEYFLNLFDDDNENREIASTVVEEQQFYPTFGRCSCNECTDAVWNAMAGNQTCGDRIGTLQNDPALQQLFPTEYDTCIQIAAVEFPTVCGSCNPDTCDGRGPKRETAQPYYCDCPDCTEEVWRRPIRDGEAQSCAAYITWAAVTMESMTDACTTIAWQYPHSECAVRCDCRPKCNCDTCTPEVLNRMAVGTNGERATCGERIAHLQSFQGGNLSPLEACQRVAGDPLEFPDICGPCNPQLCDGRVDVPSLPTVFIPTVPPFPSPIVRSKPKALPSSPPPSINVVPTPTPPPIAPTPPPTTKASCGCHSCTANVLHRLATSRNNDGVTASCLARIIYVQENKNLSETEACILVARDEFPGICGPCDPTRCNSDNVGVGTTESNNKNKTIATTRTVTIPPAIMSTPSLEGLGPNVIIFSPTTAPAEIQQTFDSIFNRQVNNEMGSERYSLYFLPGIYGSPSNPLQLQMGYYTEVAGLGEGPKDVILHGKIEVYNRCFAESPYELGQFIPTSRENGGICFALNNFWRSLSNLSIQIAHNSATTDECRKQAMFWAISQASSMRRVDISGGDLSLMDFCAHTNGVDGFASGGFIADSKHRNGKIRNGSQQQFLTRNMNMEEWDGAVWNSVFVGVNGAPNDVTFPDPPYTTLARTPLSREKPHLLVLQGQQYFVDKPSARFDSLGTSWDDTWSNTITTSTRIPLDEFFIAVPGASSLVHEINTALAAGKHLLLTPGLYEIYNTIVVTRSDTVVLGLGHATIRPMNGKIAMQIASGLEGVVVSGVTFDGGPELSPVLFQVGISGDDNSKSVGDNPENPITLHDIYFRIGGPYIGKATVCLEINSNYVLIDHTWVWRADHGIEPFDNNDGFEGDNERWRTNLGMVGVVVNGKNVTAMGLFVEHFQQHNLIWNGEGGQVLFFQNELPYDPPSQAAWDGNRPTLGWAGYKVNDSVNEHELWAAGVYCYNRNDPSIVTATGFEAPTYKAGVNVHRLYTTSLRGLGTIRTVLNSAVGASVSSSNQGPEYVVAP